MKEDLQFNIGRYDHYFDSVNNKAQFYLGLCTFLLGGYGASYLVMHQDTTCSGWIYALLALLVALNMAATFYMLRAILPYLKTGNNKDYESLIFFGSVSHLTRDDFYNRFKNATPSDIERDLAYQAHQLASGLSIKFLRLKIAGIAIALQFLFLVPFLILFFTNVKN